MKIIDHFNNTVFGPNEEDLIKYPRAEIHHQRFLHVVEVTCRVGLVGFAAYCAPVPFAIAFSIGGVLGGAYSLLVHLNQFKWTTVRNVMPACAQNFMEYLSGTKFPAVIARVVTAVFIGAHIFHDPNFFVPFCSVFLGFWVGKDIVHGAATLCGRGYKKLQKPPAPQPECGSCCHAT